jgi:hypothetical protein
MSDTLHGVPLPSGLPPPPSSATAGDFDAASRKLIEEAFRPVQEAWDRRADDMLAVLADSSLARAEVRSAVRTIRACAWIGVMAIVLLVFAAAQTLEQDRAELRHLRELDRAERTAQLDSVSKRIKYCVR